VCRYEKYLCLQSLLQMRLQKELRQHIGWSFSNQLAELSGSLLAIVIALAVLASFDDYSPP
jgi:hypothetical protein